MTPQQHAIKRTFDLVVSCTGLIVLWPLIVLVAFAVRISSHGPVFFVQKRVGRHGRLFSCVKFRTMVIGADKFGTITTATDSRTTSLGKLLRRTKLDELPQLWHVLTGSMSFVGPRPDVPGYADKLAGDDREVLDLRPGITGPATVHFRNEEQLLASVDNPQEYNDTSIWPMKVAMNKAYGRNWSLIGDIKLIVQTVLGG